MTKRRLAALAIAGLVFAIAASVGGTAVAFPTRTGACTGGCHPRDAAVQVTAIPTSNNGTTATYELGVSDTYNDGVTGWGVFDGTTRVAGADGGGSVSVAVGKTYTVYGVAGAGGAGSNSITISPIAPPPPPPPADTTPPTVVLNAPTNGAVVSGSVSLGAIASDVGSGMNRVEFRVDGALVGTDTTAPYAAAWNSTGALAGSHSIEAKAFDNVGLSSVSTIMVTIADSTAPTVGIAAPVADATVSGSVVLDATAADTESGVARVEFRVDGVLVGTDMVAPYGAAWDSTGALAGSHSIEAKAFDVAGNSAASTIGVTIAASPPPPPADLTAPTVGITAPVADATVSGSVALGATAADTESGVARVEFRVDGVLIGTDTTAPYAAAWNSTGALAGSHSIEAKAFDVAGNSAASTIGVTIATPPAPPTPPTGATATLTVSVRSESRAVREARVVLTNSVTNKEYKLRTSRQGLAPFGGLPMGTYDVRVSASDHVTFTSTVLVDSVQEVANILLERREKHDSDEDREWYRRHLTDDASDD